MPKNQRKKLKRPNGQGTVYKLKGRRRKPWIARITVGWSDKGKQLFQTIGYFETETEANMALLKHQLNPVSPKANITLGELYKEWSESRYKHISKATIATYKGAWNYLATYENEKFSELRKTHYQQIIDENLNKSRSLLEKIKALAVMLYKHAMDEDIVDKNYAENIILPKAEKKEKEIFSDFEIKKMFDNSDMEWVDTILMLIFTGMRISEFLNLTKFNVDLKNGIIIGGMKTDAGTDRLIPIHEKIMPFVQKWYNKNGDRLICDSEGKRILPKYYRENLYFPALKRLDIRPLNPHRCRHTFASIMKKAGADELSIKKIMGHTSYKFTEKVYTHTEIEQLKQAVGKI
jgi:integrase